MGSSLIRRDKPTLKKVGDRYASKTPGLIKKAGTKVLKSPTARTAAVLGFGGLNALSNDPDTVDVDIPNPSLDEVSKPLPNSKQAVANSLVDLDNPDPVQTPAVDTSSTAAREAAAAQQQAADPTKQGYFEIFLIGKCRMKLSGKQKMR